MISETMRGSVMPSLRAISVGKNVTGDNIALQVCERIGAEFLPVTTDEIIHSEPPDLDKFDAFVVLVDDTSFHDGPYPADNGTNKTSQHSKTKLDDGLRSVTGVKVMSPECRRSRHRRRLQIQNRRRAWSLLRQRAGGSIELQIGHADLGFLYGRVRASEYCTASIFSKAIRMMERAASRANLAAGETTITNGLNFADMSEL
jgi:hypothetical protein